MRNIFAHLGKLTAVLMMLASGLSWWLAPYPPPPLPALGREEVWILPAAPPSNTGKLVAAIVAANPWGAAVPATVGASLIDPEWRFLGVTVNGQERFVMIKIEGHPVQTLKEGDLLPGGAKILRISIDHLCLLINAKKRKLDIS